MIGDLLIEPFQLPYMQRALGQLLSLSLIGAVCGVHVVLRRMAFFTEALQHTVFPGVVIAFLAGESLLLGAGAAALLTVVVFASVVRPTVDRDALLAVLTSVFFAAGVVLVSRSSSFQHDLTALLFGRILNVSSAQLVSTVVVAVVVIAVLAMLHKELVLRAFDAETGEALGYRGAFLDLALQLCVAAVVVTAVQAVGTVLLVAFIVTPAAAARMLCRTIGTTMVVAAALAAACSWVGLAVSYELALDRDVSMAPAATVVLCITAVFVAAAVIATVTSERRALRGARR